MNELERYFLLREYSWEMSKILPFILVFVLIFLISFIVFYKMTHIKKRYLPLFSSGIAFAGILIYFLLFPVYKGDFSIKYTATPLDKTEMEISQGEIVVLGIPNSKHCFYIIETLNLLQKRNKDLKICYRVLSDNRSSIAIYQSAADKRIQFQLIESHGKLRSYQNFEFPTIFLVRNKELLQISNNDLGPCSLDYLERQIYH